MLFFWVFDGKKAQLGYLALQPIGTFFPKCFLSAGTQAVCQKSYSSVFTKGCEGFYHKSHKSDWTGGVEGLPQNWRSQALTPQTESHEVSPQHSKPAQLYK